MSFLKQEARADYKLRTMFQPGDDIVLKVFPE